PDGPRSLRAPRLRRSGGHGRHAADELEDLERVQQLGVVRGAVRSLGADLVESALAVHQAQQPILVAVEGELDELLRLVTRFEHRLFPAQAGDQGLGVGRALDALQDDLPHGKLDTHRVRLAELADAVDDAAFLPVEEAPDDRLDLLADGAVDLAGREHAALDQQHAVAPVGALALAHRLGVYLGRQRAAPLQIGAEAVVAVGRGGVDDVPLLDVDLLHHSFAAGLDDSRHLEAVDGVEDLRQRRLGQVAAVLKAVLHGRQAEDLPPGQDFREAA